MVILVPYPVSKFSMGTSHLFSVFKFIHKTLTVRERADIETSVIDDTDQSKDWTKYSKQMNKLTIDYYAPTR